MNHHVGKRNCFSIALYTQIIIIDLNAPMSRQLNYKVRWSVNETYKIIYILMILTSKNHILKYKLGLARRINKLQLHQFHSIIRKKHEEWWCSSFSQCCYPSNLQYKRLLVGGSSSIFGQWVTYAFWHTVHTTQNIYIYIHFTRLSYTSNRCFLTLRSDSQSNSDT